MSKKGYSVLNYLVTNGFKNLISCVIGAKDANVQKDYFEEIKTLCEQSAVTFFNRSENTVLEPVEYSVAVSWRWIINENNLIVFHDSLLPKYRGFAPLVNMLINQEKEIGVTALFASEEYDKGDIICQASRKISYPILIEDAINSITEKYNEIAGQLFLQISDKKKIVGRIQDDDKASYSLWRDEEDYLIDWTKDANYIVRFIHSVGYPYKGASTFLDKEKIRIIKASEHDDVVIENRIPGKVIFIKKGKPVVVCGEGLLLLEEMRNDDSSELYTMKNFRARFKSN